MSEELVLVLAGEEGSRHLIRPDMVLGRGRHCEVRLSGDGVARRHAVIEHFSSGFAIRAVRSRTHVFVNDERVHQRAVRPGDRVLIGDASLTVEPADPEIAWHEPLPVPAGIERPAPVARDPVPATILARVNLSTGSGPVFSATPRRRRGSSATNTAVSLVSLAIIVADAVALGFYLHTL